MLVWTKYGLGIQVRDHDDLLARWGEVKLYTNTFTQTVMAAQEPQDIVANFSSSVRFIKTLSAARTCF